MEFDRNKKLSRFFLDFRYFVKLKILNLNKFTTCQHCLVYKLYISVTGDQLELQALKLELFDFRKIYINFNKVTLYKQKNRIRLSNELYIFFKTKQKTKQKIKNYCTMRSTKFCTVSYT